MLDVSLNARAWAPSCLICISQRKTRDHMKIFYSCQAITAISVQSFGWKITQGLPSRHGPIQSPVHLVTMKVRGTSMWASISITEAHYAWNWHSYVEQYRKLTCHTWHTPIVRITCKSWNGTITELINEEFVSESINPVPSFALTYRDAGFLCIWNGRHINVEQKGYTLKAWMPLTPYAFEFLFSLQEI